MAQSIDLLFDTTNDTEVIKKVNFYFDEFMSNKWDQNVTFDEYLKKFKAFENNIQIMQIYGFVIFSLEFDLKLHLNCNVLKTRFSIISLRRQYMAYPN